MNSIFKYTENNGDVIITGLKEGVSDTSIVIPETIDGMPVTAIGAKAFEFTSITDIKIGANIRKIGNEAFSYCAKLIAVRWNCKCNAIPDYCFLECSNLTSFDFSSIKKIGIYAFGVSGLQEVCLPKNIEIISTGTFSRCNGLRSVTWNGTCDVIPADCFAFCSNLTNFDFSGIKKVGTGAFEKSGLTSVTLSKGTIVCKKCFVHCKSLAKVEWLSDRSIRGDIFAECKNIKEILISDKVMNIAVGAFAASPNAEISFV